MRHRSTPKPFDKLRPSVAAKILRLRREGLSQRLIALESGVSQATVSRVIAQSLDELTAPPAPRFELVAVRSEAEVASGRSYALAPHRSPSGRVA